MPELDVWQHKDVELSEKKWETRCLEKWYGTKLRRIEGKHLVADFTLNASDSNQSCFSRELLDFLAYVVIVVENNGRRTNSVNCSVLPNKRRM